MSAAFRTVPNPAARLCAVFESAEITSVTGMFAMAFRAEARIPESAVRDAESAVVTAVPMAAPAPPSARITLSAPPPESQAESTPKPFSTSAPACVTQPESAVPAFPASPESAESRAVSAAAQLLRKPDARLPAPPDSARESPSRSAEAAAGRWVSRLFFISPAAAAQSTSRNAFANAPAACAAEETRTGMEERTPVAREVMRETAAAVISPACFEIPSARLRMTVCGSEAIPPICPESERIRVAAREETRDRRRGSAAETACVREAMRPGSSRSRCASSP